VSSESRRVTIKWTDTAKAGLRQLPKAVRRGLLRKADLLYHADDPGGPQSPHKPLTGPLQGYYRITHGRYRAIYTVKKRQTRQGEVRWHIHIIFIAAGIRKERSKDDVYRLAHKLVKLGLVKTNQQRPRSE